MYQVLCKTYYVNSISKSIVTIVIVYKSSSEQSVWNKKRMYVCSFYQPKSIAILRKYSRVWNRRATGNNHWPGKFGKRINIEPWINVGPGNYMQPAQIKLHPNDNFLCHAKVQPPYFAGLIKRALSESQILLLEKKSLTKNFVGWSLNGAGTFQIVEEKKNVCCKLKVKPYFRGHIIVSR